MIKCTECKNEMVEGYMVEGEAQQFCSAECLEKQYPNTVAELEAMTEEEFDNSLIFWTDWDEEQDEDEEPCSQCGDAKECINCNPSNYIDETDHPLALGEEVTPPSNGYKVKGHRGTWYVISIKAYELKGIMTQLFLMEHETYGDEAPCVIIDLDGQVIMEDVHNGWDDLQYRLDEGIALDNE